MSAEIRDRQMLYDYLDGYAAARREELNQHRLKPGMGLLKTYLLETSADGRATELEGSFAAVGWKLRPIDDALYRVEGMGVGLEGYLDALTPRYLALYTPSPSAPSNRAVTGAVRHSVELDHAWLSSPILNTIWRELVPADSPRYATLRYESEPAFETLLQYPRGGIPEDEEYDDSDLALPERQATARLEVKHRVRRLREHLLPEQVLGGLFGNLTGMRVPATNEQGRYEYFYYGKLTDRGQDFRTFRGHLSDVVIGLYGKLTELIEETASFRLERQSMPGGNRWRVQGALVTFEFSSPLRDEIFERFVELTFERGQGPFRLWGNPLRLSGPKVHVYGLDLHLWQEIYLDLSPDRFLLVLPEGTCGNTVHRLLTNIQRYLDPRVKAYVGEVPYEDLVRRALRAL
jgi:hypothetical protein